MGHLLTPGDLVRGYDLSTCVFGSQEFPDNFTLPDIILVKKIHLKTQVCNYETIYKSFNIVV